MRNIIGIALLCASFGLFSACHKSSDDNIAPGGGTAPAAGTWKVSYFWNKKDETSSCAGYVFEFAANGNLTATVGNQTYSGTWSTGFDDSKNKFLIQFPGSAPSALEELSEDWLIVEMNDDSMHFEHTSGGNGGTDVLKFEKI